MSHIKIYHDIEADHSLLQSLCGELEWIFINRNDAMESSMVSLRFENGAVGNLHFAAGASGRSPLERTEIIGEGTNIVIDNNIRLTHYRKGDQPGYGRESSYFGEDSTAALHWESEFSLANSTTKASFYSATRRRSSTSPPV